MINHTTIKSQNLFSDQSTPTNFPKSSDSTLIFTVEDILSKLSFQTVEK